MTTDLGGIPDVLAWPLAEAVDKLERAEIRVVVKEASLPSRLPVGSEQRVVRVKDLKGAVELVAVKVQTEPVGDMPPA